MEPDQADKVFRMIESHEVLSMIGMNIVFDREKFNEHACGHYSEGEVLVIFEIPREISMPFFYGEFYKTLNQESQIINSLERRG